MKILCLFLLNGHFSDSAEFSLILAKFPMLTLWNTVCKLGGWEVRYMENIITGNLITIQELNILGIKM